jgi:hypothetical protein
MSQGTKDKLTLAAILLLAAVLRFTGFADWSLSNDELSAVTRLDFGSFHELITNGVRPDFHPAGVQVFLYYWIKIFGNDVWAVRLPFVTCGILSVWYCYRIAKRWFNVNVAQLAAITLACLSYPILYSQLARPYSPGLLFSLGLVFHWTRYLFDNDKSKLNLAAFVLFMAGCMYTHYFSFFFAVMVGATGLLFLKKENYLAYFIAAGSAVILFLPHIGITLEQFSRGGVGTWLGKPESDFLRHYFYYSFNESVLFIIAFIGLFVLSILTNARSIRPNKFRIICVAWFLIPFFFGYYYSVYRNPILQYSVLLFSFPFLIIYLQSYYCDRRTKFRYVLLTLVAVGSIYSAAKEQRFFSLKPFGVFKELTEKKMVWDKKFEKNIPTVFNVITPAYLDYYFKKSGNEMKWNWLRGDDSSPLQKCHNILDTCNSQYFIYGWSNSACPPEVYELIKAKYDSIVEDHVYFNSRITLFASTSGKVNNLLWSSGHHRGSTFWSSINDSIHWNVDWNSIDTMTIPGKIIFPIKESVEYSSGFSEQFYKLTSDSLNYVNLSANVYMPAPADLEMVVEIREHLTDSVYEWRSVKMSNAIEYRKNCYRFFMTEKIPKRTRPEDKLKLYLWNHSKTGYYIENMSVSSYKDMDYAPIQDVKELIKLKKTNEQDH